MSEDRLDDPQDDFPSRRQRDQDAGERKFRARDYDDDLAADYDDYAGDVRALIMSKVKLPALFLIICGGLLFFFGVLLIVGGIVMFTMAKMPKGEEIVGIIYVIGGAVCVPYAIAMMFGAMRMNRLRSHTFSVVSAVMAIASVACLGVCGFFVMPIGVWALIVLLDAEVKKEFKKVERELSYD